MNDSNSFMIDFGAAEFLTFNALENPMIDPQVLRVYLASPLTQADPETIADCERIRVIARRLFESYDYLGIRFEVYDPGEVTPPGSEHTSEEVYITDHNRTATADLVVFHVNCPSLGVGMEAQIAAGATVPRVVVSKRSTAVSRMFLGLFSPTVSKIEYSTASEFEAALSAQLGEIARRTVDSAKRRRPFVEDICELELGRTFFKQRILHGITIEQLATAVDTAEFFLRRLERDPRLAASVTQIQLCRIASTINCTVGLTAFGRTKLTVTDSELPPARKQSLNNLVDFVTGQTEWLPDARVFRLWQDYVEETKEELQEAIRHRSDLEKNVNYL